MLKYDEEGFWLALMLAFSPWEKEGLAVVSGLADECLASSVAGIFKRVADVSPSPGGEGRGEVEPFS